ncbi:MULTISPECIES: TetR/AcrR family transcriptional regulator [unclassified Parafrankia]|uniref:TetR/AcrR family transcriptional regulator n=1 Tax=unclassified Parafrankia TaxID=2994368 RepID=UPI000DA5962D|nr:MULTISPECIES: TetR/AcrR family transcriptional regulator [unclassified Parafrankia]TCJ33500.1 TetR/AcrR family transcriptional regulator [Parafrankia sp. BMG5.11]SQD97731.1 TetR family transcriptional regulator [Parafrankia sp. Ea1.12]
MTPTNGNSTAIAIREAAARLFYERGYEATSLREIAAAVGIQVGSLYNHIGGKNELLQTIMIEIMDGLLAAMQEAISFEEDAEKRLVRALDCHLRFHATHSRDVFIGNSELRALTAEARQEVASRRNQYECQLRRLVAGAGTDLPEDSVDNRLQTYSILAIGTHLSSWYREDGPMSLEEVVDCYTQVILRQLGIVRLAAL